MVAGQPDHALDVVRARRGEPDEVRDVVPGVRHRVARQRRRRGTHDPSPLNTTTSPRSMPRMWYTSRLTRIRSPTRRVFSIDADGMLKTWNRNTLMTTVSTSAATTMMASSRQNGRLRPPARPPAFAPPPVAAPSSPALSSSALSSSALSSSALSSSALSSSALSSSALSSASAALSLRRPRPRRLGPGSRPTAKTPLPGKTPPTKRTLRQLNPAGLTQRPLARPSREPTCRYERNALF